MSIETKSKGVGVFKYILIFEVLALIGLLIAALVMMFTNFDNIDRLMIGVYMMYGVAGFVPVIIMPTLVIMFTRKRSNIFSTLQNMKASQIGPYAPGYKPSGAKNPSFCEYCGYEVHYGERECPECGGPVRTVKSSYI